MNKNKMYAKRIVAVFLFALGLVLGVTWNSEKYCIGDEIFIALGISPWSNGSTGTHYPAVIGIVFILIGIVVLNLTLQKKARLWLWAIIILSLIIINLTFSCV